MNNIIKFENENGLANCYAIFNENNFYLIDCTISPQKFYSYINTNYLNKNISNKSLNKILNCCGIIITHAHADHLVNLQEWINIGAVVYGHKLIFDKLKNKMLNSKIEYFGGTRVTITEQNL